MPLHRWLWPFKTDSERRLVVRWQASQKHQVAQHVAQQLADSDPALF